MDRNQSWSSHPIDQNSFAFLFNFPWFISCPFSLLTWFWLKTWIMADHHSPLSWWGIRSGDVSQFGLFFRMLLRCNDWKQSSSPSPRCWPASPRCLPPSPPPPRPYSLLALLGLYSVCSRLGSKSKRGKLVGWQGEPVLVFDWMTTFLLALKKKKPNECFMNTKEYKISLKSTLYNQIL